MNGLVRKTSWDIERHFPTECLVPTRTQKTSWDIERHFPTGTWVDAYAPED